MVIRICISDHHILQFQITPITPSWSVATTEKTHDPTPTSRTALIIGVTGSFGGHAAQALLKHGWRIQALARDPKAAAQGRPAHPDRVGEGRRHERRRCSWRPPKASPVIVRGANPPGYRNWAGLALPMLRSTIDAAIASGARIVFPGTVYNFAPDSGPRIDEDAPQAPLTRKGKIRVEMERRLRIASVEAQGADRARRRLFRPGEAEANGLGWMTTRSRGRLRSVHAAGPADVGHAFAYLPDLGETTARLLDREAELADFDVFHFGGQWLERSDELAASIRRVTAEPKLPIKPFPHWMVLCALAGGGDLPRASGNALHLQRKPIGLDNTKLVAFLGAEPHTSLDGAIRATLDDMGCLPEPVEHSSFARARA